MKPNIAYILSKNTISSQPVEPWSRISTIVKRFHMANIKAITLKKKKLTGIMYTKYALGFSVYKYVQEPTI